MEAGWKDAMLPLAGLVDAAWYRARYPEVDQSGLDPLEHFVRFGAAERRDPNRFFDSAWYIENNPDVAAAGINPLLHYLQAGGAELRRPSPRFDAAWYAAEHPEAAQNPLLYHLRIGLNNGYLTEKPLVIGDYLQSGRPPLAPPHGVFADALLLVDADAPASRARIQAVLDRRALPLARVIVIDDRMADAALAAWLQALAEDGLIVLVRNRRRLGFSACLAQAVEHACGHDLVLLEGVCDLPPDWPLRLAAHAYAHPTVATVSTLPAPAAEGLDALARQANAARSVVIPSAGGNCIYLRAEALRCAVLDGGLEAICGRMGEAGWHHRMACDLFTGNPLSDETADAAAPAVFALSAATMRRSGRPVILMVSHDHGGGVRRHIDGLIARHTHDARFLLLEGGDHDVTLSVPDTPAHPKLSLPPDRIEDLVRLLRSMAVTRVHIHHLLKMGMDMRRLVHRLRVPFDVTVHDFFAICPQINLLRWPEATYCGEPEPAACNACVAENNQHGARDIFAWRRDRAWQFLQAERVICPSEDARARLARYGLARNVIVEPHETQPATEWLTKLPRCSGPVLRIAVLGVLANHKGARTVAAVAEAARRGAIRIHLIGHTEPSFPQAALPLIQQTGQYREEDLGALLREVQPHVFWFPSSTPETYSYTLTAAIETGFPIVATKLGAFPHRLAGRPNTWLVDHHATAAEWLAVFEEVRAVLRSRPAQRPARREPALTEFYIDHYLLSAPTIARGVRPRMVVVPERQEAGALSIAAYLRLLQPLDHPAIGGEYDIMLADAETAAGCQAELFVTQRTALKRMDLADRLLTHAHRSGGRVIYDLDDDLATPPPDGATDPAAALVRHLVTEADEVWLSGRALARKLSPLRRNAAVVETRLDERIWDATPQPAPHWPDPVRVLCMGATSHAAELELIAPVLTRLKTQYGDRVSFDVLGMTSRSDLPEGLDRLMLPTHASRSYPGFVHWLTTARPIWHVGLAPMLNTASNRFRSATRVLDYAAMGMVVLASDVPTHRGTVADGTVGQLVANNQMAWYTALNWVIRNHALRQEGWRRSRQAFAEHGTLASHAPFRRELLADPRAVRRAG